MSESFGKRSVPGTVPTKKSDSRRGLPGEAAWGLGRKLALGSLPVKASHACLANNRSPEWLRLGHPHRPVCQDIFQSMLQVTIRCFRRVPRIVYPPFVTQDAPAVQHKDEYVSPGCSRLIHRSLLLSTERVQHLLYK